jgi:4-amino-4-deoxychorismate lyase
MRLIETIKIKNGKIYNIKWHNQRCNRTRLELFGISKPIFLEDYITNPPKKGLFRCRILYNTEILSITYIPYTPKDGKLFKVVSSNIEYNYKYSNRDELDSLKEKNREYDDIIIEKDGLLTDTTIANIAFYKNDSWITPKKPLLQGTLRAKLIDEKKIVQKDIKSEDLKHFSHFALMNAMIGFQIKKNIIIYIDSKEKICL